MKSLVSSYSDYLVFPSPPSIPFYQGPASFAIRPYAYAHICRKSVLLTKLKLSAFRIVLCCSVWNGVAMGYYSDCEGEEERGTDEG
jgi:hypothetical protein